MTIGDRIKELRKKNDLTQEKLADFLRVSPQAVSKWECGLACPDLALIAPLTKLLHVSADELLGLIPDEIDAKREEIQARYDATFKTGDISARMRITEEAVREYPGDMMWLNHYAWDVWCDAVSCEDDADFRAGREKAIGLFETVIENAQDEKIKAHAITGIVQCLCGKGDKAQARRYADLYPESRVSAEEKEQLIGMCLDGEEQLRHKQRYLKRYVDTLVDALIWKHAGSCADAFAAAEGILAAVHPDGDYFDHHHAMCHIRMQQAEDAMRRGDADAARAKMREAMAHAKAYDDIDSVNPREYVFTSPLFCGLTLDSREWCHTGTGTLAEDVRTRLGRPVFVELRGMFNHS